MPTAGWKVESICNGLRRTDDREALADALTQVAALECSPDGMRMRSSLVGAGALQSANETLLAADGDIRLMCKAANALGSLCMSEEVARGFVSTPTSSAVLDRLSDMLRTRSQWAQADAVGCLGWLVGSMNETALHELVPLVTQLMAKHMETDDSIFIEEERRRKERPRWGSSSSSSSGSSGNGRGQDSWRSAGRRPGGGGGQQQCVKSTGVPQKDNASIAEAVRERMDNIRVYSLIFLVKAAHADPSTVTAMVAANAIPALVRHLSTGPFATSLSKQGPPRERQAVLENHRGGEGLEEKKQGSDESPSLLLSARLLYAFSLVPDVRESLLRAKCLPPLIRIRLRFQQHAKAGTDTTAERDDKHEQQQQQQQQQEWQSRHPLARDDVSSGVTPAEASRDEGSRRHGAGQRCDSGDAAHREDACSASNGGGKTPAQHGGAKQPSFEAMISLIISQLVGKA